MLFKLPTLLLFTLDNRRIDSLLATGLRTVSVVGSTIKLSKSRDFGEWGSSNRLLQAHDDAK
jgi:hypothetical protein